MFKQEAQRQAAAAGSTAPPDASATAIEADYAHSYTTRFRSYASQRAKVLELFDSVDKDKNGQLDNDELLALLQKGAPKDYLVSATDTEYIMAKCDADKNGAITRNEVRGPTPALRCLLRLRFATE